MTTGPPASDFSTVFSTLADAMSRGDVPAYYRALDGLYLAAWHSLWHFAGPYMLMACFFPFFSFVFRGPLGLRMARIAIVSSDGWEASRRRIFCRSLVTWSPMWLLTAYLTASRPGFRSLDSLESALAAHPIAVLAAYGTLIVGTVVATAQPERGLQDRLAGTWLVPR